jgi:hypothetical protein
MVDAPHPRVLFHDVLTEDLLEELKALAGTWALFKGNVADIHASDWDLVVSFAAVPYVSDNMHLLSFGAQRFPAYYSGGFSVSPIRSDILNARSVRVAVDGDISGLVERSIAANDPGPGRRKRLQNMPAKAIPLVTVGDEEDPWAAIFTYASGPIVYALPAETTNHVQWLAAALKMLHEIDAGRFPAEPDWRQGEGWATPGLLAAHEDLAMVERERKAALRVFDSRAELARSALVTEAASAAAGMQRLLTAAGDDLVAAVADVLTEFGFQCEDMDAHHDATNGAKLEDLRVTSTDGEGHAWTALVEVKGYSKGAKANDVAQIFGRPARAYLKETGQDAEGLWHIVNVWREHDPSTRDEPFSGANDLLVLEDNGGCAVDTRDLFRAWRDLKSGVITAEELRGSLMAARGRWKRPVASRPSVSER